MKKERSVGETSVRNDRWWRDMWSPYSTLDLWKKNFRMSQEEFIELCEQLTHFITPIDLHAFFISNTFMSNARLKFAKKQANAKQHPKAKPLLFFFSI